MGWQNKSYSGKLRQRRRPDPQRLAGALEGWMKRGRTRGGSKQRQLQQQWEAAAGEKIAAHTRVVGFSRMILQVRVDSSTLLSELAAFHRDNLLKRLREGERPLLVREIRFRLVNEGK